MNLITENGVQEETLDHCLIEIMKDTAENLSQAVLNSHHSSQA